MSETAIEDRIATTLRAIAASPASARDDWWIIGSTAAWLCGFDHAPRDVDLAGSTATMRAFLEGFGVSDHATDDDGLFRSDPFLELPISGGLPIEVQGDLKVRKGESWVPLVCRTRMPVERFGLRVFVVEPSEQIEMFRFFGRRKDIDKADRFAALIFR